MKDGWGGPALPATPAPRRMTLPTHSATVGACTLVVVTKSPAEDDSRRLIDAWFLRRGFRLSTHADGEIVWADLLTAAGRTVAPRYGRGSSRLEAAQRAMQRYLAEE